MEKDEKRQDTTTNDDKVRKATQNDGDRRRQTTTSESPIEPESNSNSSKVDFIMLF